MTNNNIWDCADMRRMISAKWSIDDSSVFLQFFFVFLVCKCILVIDCCFHIHIIYQGTDILPEIFSSSPDTRVFVARKLHKGASPRVILSDKHEYWTARKNFWRYSE
jgi:hypothetical protein